FGVTLGQKHESERGGDRLARVDEVALAKAGVILAAKVRVVRGILSQRDGVGDDRFHLLGAGWHQVVGGGVYDGVGGGSGKEGGRDGGGDGGGGVLAEAHVAGVDEARQLLGLCCGRARVRRIVDADRRDAHCGA